MTQTASYLLPSLHPTIFAGSDLSIRHTRPHVPVTASPPPQISTRPPISFQCAPEHRMIVFNWRINIPLSDIDGFEMFSYKLILPRSAILARGSHTTVEPEVAVNWEDWGPANTRLWGHTTTWDIDVDDSRVFTTDPFWDDVGNGGRYVDIITPLSHDSRPRKSDLTNETDLERANTLTYIVPSSIPTILSMPEIFSNGTVTTRLGCRIVRLLDHDISEHIFGSLMVDEEHIIWIPVRYPLIHP